MEEIKPIKIPDSILNSIKESQESYKKFHDNIQNIISKLPEIDIHKLEVPFFKNKEFILPPNIDVIHEENAWKRHKQTLDMQNDLLVVQEKILKEQQSTSKMTFLIIVLTILGIGVTILSIFL